MGLGLGFTLNGEFPLQPLGFRVRVIHLDLEVGLELFLLLTPLGLGLGFIIWTWDLEALPFGLGEKVQPHKCPLDLGLGLGFTLDGEFFTPAVGL